MIRDPDTIMEIINRRIIESWNRWKKDYMPQDQGACDELEKLLEEIERGNDDETD